LDWLFYAIGGVIALGSIWLFVWALFRDRARARFRCPRCWYDLTGAEGAAPTVPVTCSECGRVTAKTRSLRKTRRRWGSAALALVMLLGSGAIANYPKVNRYGWLSLVPTWFLIDTMPRFGYPTALSDELVQRCGCWPRLKPRLAGAAYPAWRLSPREHAYVVNRAVRGTPGARPVSDVWQRTYGEFMDDAYPTFQSTTREARRNLPVLQAIATTRELPPVVNVRTRAVWPTEYPVWIELTQRDWWSSSTSYTLQWRSTHGPRWDPILSDCLVIDHARLGASDPLEIEIRVSWDRNLSNSSFDRAKEFSFSLPCRVGGSFADIMAPVRDAALDRLIQQGASVHRSQVFFDSSTTFVPGAQGVAFGVIIDCVHEGKVLRSERFWWPGGLPSHSTTYSDMVFQPLDFESGDVVTVRIRSDPETALRVFDADKYWQGDVTVNLTIP